MLSKLEAQSSRDREKRSLAIGQRLFALEIFKKSSCVCFYVSTPKEVDTHGMIDRALETRKHVLVPRVDLESKKLAFFEIKERMQDLEPGAHGILEPRVGHCRRARTDEMNLLIVPGLAFDSQMRRLGRGAGFYDRCLESLKPGTYKIGLAFSFQNVPEIPEETHDEKVDLVLTD